MDLTEYLKEKLGEYQNKKKQSKYDQGYLTAIEEISLLIGLNPDMHGEIVKVTKDQFLNSVWGNEETVLELLDIYNPKEIVIEVLEGIKTGGCYINMYLSADISIDGCDLETPGYTQHGIDENGATNSAGSYTSFLDYLGNGLFPLGGGSRKTYLGGLSSGRGWQNIFDNNKVSELFERELLDYLTSRNINLSLSYDIHSDT